MSARKLPPYRLLNRGVMTWLSISDHDKLKLVADRNGLSIASFVRGCISDALAEETATQSPSQQSASVLPHL
jgi:predicted HicB family RNase H-like nuclease